jgi:hypothetical protein
VCAEAAAVANAEALASAAAGCSRILNARA